MRIWQLVGVALVSTAFATIGAYFLLHSPTPPADPQFEAFEYAGAFECRPVPGAKHATGEVFFDTAYEGLPSIAFEPVFPDNISQQEQIRLHSEVRAIRITDRWANGFAWEYRNPDVDATATVVDVKWVARGIRRKANP
jgi:hypothetical protein